MIRGVRFLSMMVSLMLVLLSGTGAAAQSSGSDQPQSLSADWVDTSLTTPTTRLFTPSSGALLAISSDGLMRSDDAGDTWRAIPTPGTPLAVDPTSQDVLYATSKTAPLQRSSDAGATWTTLMDAQAYPNQVVDAFAVSPADPRLLYAGLKRPGISDEYWLYRSTDAGSTWTQLFHAQNTLCGWGVGILSAHPTDTKRLLFAGGCHAGRDFNEALQQSVDQGQTFTTMYGTGTPGPKAASGFPQAIVGGNGAAPGRWYLALNRDQRFGGSLLTRSDNDGAGWATVLDYVGGGLNDPDKSNWSIKIAALAYDAANPDTVYVARNAFAQGNPPTLTTSGVTVSPDGGQTWNDLGGQQVGTIADLALGIDGRYLFLATDRGVARLPLSDVQAPGT